MTPQVTKGHGTANDFVLVEDPEAQQAIPAETVRSLTDRRRGIGADGLIRVVRSAALAEGDERVPHADEAVAAGATWFMDYRNADGSIAQMCGNGVRVFAHYLVTRGLADPASPILVGTRGGVKTVTLVPDPTGGSAPWYRVDMGVWRMPLLETDAGAAADAVVTTSDQDVARPAVSVDMGNPHTVVALPDLQQLIGADLAVAPAVQPVPADGTNVEFIVVDADGDGDPRTGTLRMRVHERGVGETMACGTGACAAALAARFWAGPDGPVDWTVEQPGGPVRVEIEGPRVFLSGPAVLVADATLLHQD
jgi:diaminopimelate epimerase